jgi:hypothetical protein
MPDCNGLLSQTVSVSGTMNALGFEALVELVVGAAEVIAPLRELEACMNCARGGAGGAASSVGDSRESWINSTQLTLSRSEARQDGSAWQLREPPAISGLRGAAAQRRLRRVGESQPGEGSARA